MEEPEPQPKLVLVTGGAGFIGSHLCERLVAEGYSVISLDNYFTGSPENHHAGVVYIEGHTKAIADILLEVPDVIFHLGEYSRVEKSFDEPDVVWDLNIAGTFGVLEYCRKNKIKLVYAGSSTKFADGGLGRDQSPYAWTKATNTELVRDYGEWYGLNYAIAYFYNVYGPRERAGIYGTLIEIFRQKYLHGEILTIVAPGTQKRNFTHVDDIVDGLVKIGDSGEGDNFGIGDERAYSILEVAEMFDAPIELLPERKGNRMAAEIDTSKTRLLGWEIQNNLADYIKEIQNSKDA
jgi:UDP-glucose 4-epimerase